MSLVGQMWDDIIKVMTSATVRFELLSTVHTSPVSELDLVYFIFLPDVP